MPYADFFNECKKQDMDNDQIRKLYSLSRSKKAIVVPSMSAERMIEICECDLPTIAVCEKYGISTRDYHKIRNRVGISPARIKRKISELSEDEIAQIKKCKDKQISDILTEHHISLVTYYKINPVDENTPRKSRVGTNMSVD